MRRLAWLVPLALALPAASAAPAAAADRVVVDPGLEQLDAFGSRLLGTREGELLVFRAGAQRELGSAGGAPDLGLDRRGRLIAVYSRCRGRPSCALYRRGIASGREQRIRSLDSRRDETSPAIWSGRLLFVRSGRRGGLFKTRPLRRISRLLPHDTDLRGRTAAFIVTTGDVEDSVDKVYVKRFSRRGRGRSCVVGIAGENEELGSVKLSGAYVYWLAVGTDQPTFVLRRRLPSRRCVQRGRAEVVRQFGDAAGTGQIASSIAVAGGRLFYTADAFSGPITYEATDPPLPR